MRAKLVRESLYESEHRDVNNSIVAYELSDNEEEATYASSWTYVKIERGNDKNNKINELIERAKKGLHLKKQKDKLGIDKVNNVEYFYNNDHGGVLICRFSHGQDIIYLGNYTRVHDGWVVIQQTLDFDRKFKNEGVIDEKELDKLITNRNISYANDLKGALQNLGFKIENLARKGFIKSGIHKDAWHKKSD